MLPEDPAGPSGHDRLGAEARPTRYTLDLTIDPRVDTTLGVVRIELELATATRELRLHAESMRTIAATVEAGGDTIPATATMGPHGGLGLTLAREIAAGPATLVIEYEGSLDEVPVGLYRVEEGDAWYAFTQFEPLEARKALPCFDQPEFKTPWEVTLRVPDGMTALTNAPEASSMRAPGSAVAAAS